MTIRAGGADLPVQAASDTSHAVAGWLPTGVMSRARGHLVRADAVPFGVPGPSPLQS